MAVLESMQNTTDIWTSLLEGKQEALQQLQRTYASKPNGSNTMGLGIAYLWLYQYEQAWEHFHKTITEDSMKGDAFFGMAGVAKWCLGETQQAVSQWRAGLRAKYARASGLGVRMPLLLFFASVVKQPSFKKEMAESLLMEKVKDRRIKNWPGPIALLVLRQINEDEFQSLCRGDSEEDTLVRQWLAEFYRCLIQFEESKLPVLRASMRKLADTNQPKNILLNRIWNEEYFLARHEAGDSEKEKGSPIRAGANR